MELQEEEEEGKAGCFLLLPPLTGQRSTCTYLTLPTSSRTCDYPYRLQKLREGEEFSAHQLHGYSPPPSLLHAYLLSSHKITDNTEYQLSPHLSTKARAKPSKQKTVDPPPRNIIRKTGPNHATGRTTSHPIPPFHHQPLSSPLQQNKASFFSETGKGKTLACLQGWKKKTAASLAFKPLRRYKRATVPYFTLPCLALPGRYMSMCKVSCGLEQPVLGAVLSRCGAM